MTDASPRAIVIDDDPAVRELFQDILEDEQVSVVGYSHAGWLARASDSIGPILIVLDPHQGRRGADWSMIDRLQADKTLHHVPILVVSSLPIPRDRGDAADWLRYLRKPFELDDFLSLVHRCLVNQGV